MLRSDHREAFHTSLSLWSSCGWFLQRCIAWLAVSWWSE